MLSLSLSSLATKGPTMGVDEWTRFSLTGDYDKEMGIRVVRTEKSVVMESVANGHIILRTYYTKQKPLLRVIT